MKITQIAAGLAALNTSRPIGSHASGETGRNRLTMGDDHGAEELEAPDHEAQRNAQSRSHAEADGHALQRVRMFQPIPWSLGPLR